MTLEATITKMMWIMGMGDQTFEEMKRDFYRLVNHDILLRNVSRANSYLSILLCLCKE